MGGRGNSGSSARRNLWPMFRWYERGIPWWEVGEGTDPAREGAQPGMDHYDPMMLGVSCDLLPIFSFLPLLFSDGLACHGGSR